MSRRKHAILLFCAICAMIFPCCSQRRATTAAPAPDSPGEFVTDSFSYTSKNEHGSCEVYMDYPRQDGSPIANAVTDFIRSTLFENGSTLASSDPAVMTREYCIQTLDKMGKTLEQMGIRHVHEDDAPEEGTELRMIYQSEHAVTYEVYRYSYLTNGAHGEYAEYGVTFRRSDGKRMGNIIRETDPSLHALLREGLRQYFDVDTDEELQRICTVDISEPPLPTFPPYLTGSGVRFHYSIYDVCDFDDGDPSFTIPYSRIAPYLTGEAQSLTDPR